MRFDSPSCSALQKIVQASAIAISILLIGGCASSPLSFAPNFSWSYKADIQQGTVVTKEMAEKLEVGMGRDQVRFILGTPLVADIFHANRWDYPYRFLPGRGEIIDRKLTVFFDNDRMTRFESSPLPTELEFRNSQQLKPPVIPDAPGDSWWQKLKGVFGV